MITVDAVIFLLILVLAGAVFAVWTDVAEQDHNKHMAKHRCPDKNCKEHVDDFEHP